ncbi:MAG TPA: amidophosphoribosyltransferase [Elusimicrobia bacterium]|nr:amidophosphoribosyltransferase [Elusimicrobiota bacterium]
MCGIIGIIDSPDAVSLTHLGLFALQHRGQESAGIAAARNGALRGHAAMGLVSEVFSQPVLQSLAGDCAIGHVRYSTTGSSHVKNAQPLIFQTAHGPVAVAHNGNLTNAAALRAQLEQRGAIFQSDTDTEIIVHLLAREAGSIEEAVINSLRQVEGSYCLLILTPDRLIAARDPYGFRPLVLGELGGDRPAAVLSSETSALNLLQARLVREIEPGELLVARGGTARSLKPLAPKPLSRCVFEAVYFARPDSKVFGRNVQSVRRELGRELARQTRGLQADIVVPVPDSGVSAALGFSDESGIPFEMALVRSHYISRTFIKPSQKMRELAAQLKLSPVPETLQGKRVVLVDDSIVRGTTSLKITKSLRKAGAREIHMAVSSPPIMSSCYYGIDTPRREELIANRHRIDEIRKFLEVDSLHYLELDRMLRAANGCPACAGDDSQGFCSACFTGHYPAPIPDYENITAAEPPRRPLESNPL